MYALPTAPRPIGGVLDDAIRLYRASLGRCWGLALVAGLVSGAVNLYLQLQFGTFRVAGAAPQTAATLLSRMQAVERQPGVWLAYLAMIVVWLTLRAAIIARQHATAIGSEDSFGAALAFGLRRLPSIIIAGLIWMIVVGAGMVLLLIPGIWLWGRFELWLVACCVEELGPGMALGRSWQLTEHNWWRATTIMTVALIIVLVLSLTAGFAVGAVVGFSRGNVALFTLATQVLTGLVGIFTIPMLTVVMLAIYYDLKLRREGGDLAVRLSSLQPA